MVDVAVATVPLCDRAIAACPVMRAFLVAPLITNTIGLLASSTMSIVRPTASRSSGEGRVGIRTRSAIPTTARISNRNFVTT